MLKNKNVDVEFCDNIVEKVKNILLENLHISLDNSSSYELYEQGNPDKWYEHSFYIAKKLKSFFEKTHKIYITYTWKTSVGIGYIGKINYIKIVLKRP